jgi:hypothetical protein
MFEHIDIEKFEITKIDSPSGRKYQTPSGNLYPSITTVLSQTSDNSFLEMWRNKIGREKADKISEFSINCGNNLHQACEDYLNNKVPVISNAVTKVHFRQLKPFLNKLSKIHCLEIPLYSDSLKVAGTVDCIAFYENTLVAIDFKNSRKIKKEEWIEGYFIQATFYAIAFSEMYGIPVNKIVIMIATDESIPCIFIKNVLEYKIKLENIVNEYYSKKS